MTKTALITMAAITAMAATSAAGKPPTPVAALAKPDEARATEAKARAHGKALARAVRDVSPQVRRDLARLMKAHGYRALTVARLGMNTDLVLHRGLLGLGLGLGSIRTPPRDYWAERRADYGDPKLERPGIVLALGVTPEDVLRAIDGIHHDARTLSLEQFEARHLVGVTGAYAPARRTLERSLKVLDLAEQSRPRRKR